MSWRDDAACKGMDTTLFFSEGRGDGSVTQNQQAKEICRTCPVKLDCLEWALTFPEMYGVWGGVSAASRRRMRRRPTPKNHGTKTAYVNGCRCDTCRTANREALRKYRGTEPANYRVKDTTI